MMILNLVIFSKSRNIYSNTRKSSKHFTINLQRFAASKEMIYS